MEADEAPQYPPPGEPVSWPLEVMNQRVGRVLAKGYKNALEKMIREPSGLGMDMEPGEDLSARPGQRPAGDGFSKWVEYQIPREEADQLLDLVSGIFQYDFDERLMTFEVTSHPWFEGCLSNAGHQDVDMYRNVEKVNEEAVDDVADRGLEGTQASEDRGKPMSEDEYGPAPVEAADNGEDHKGMTDNKPTTPQTAVQTVEVNEVLFDAGDTPAEVVAVDFVGRVFTRLKGMFLRSVGGAAGACLGVVS